MKRLIIAAVSLSFSLGGFGAVATAQDKGGDSVITDASGASVTSTAGLNPVASGEGSTIVYGDINTGGEGRTVIAPPTVIQNGGAPPPGIAPAPEPAPVAEAAPEEVIDTSGADAAVATGTDLDGDNYPDALEYDLGLDPNNIDTDGDGVADGDELNIYGSDPTVYDSDGDGVSDGSELFDSRTDPLVWDDFSTETTEIAAQQAAVVPRPTASIGSVELAQKTKEILTADDGNAAALGTGNASAAPGSVTKSGLSILSPDGTYNVSETSPPVISVGEAGDFAPAPVEVVAEPAPEAVAEPAPEAVPVDTTSAEAAIASDDADGDNYPDALEYDLGLDPANIDTDGDGVADGDELNIYGTDPTVYDGDGDGVSDGGELFDSRTDPLVWDDFSASTAESTAPVEATTEQ